MDSPTSGIEESSSFRRQLREANQLIHDTLRGEGPDYAIAFVCECGEAGCFQTVWLTVAEYESHRADSRPIVGVEGIGPRTREIVATNAQAA